MATATVKTISKDLVKLTIGPKEAAALAAVLGSSARPGKRLTAIIDALESAGVDTAPEMVNFKFDENGYRYVNVAVAA